MSARTLKKPLAKMDPKNTLNTRNKKYLLNTLRCTVALLSWP